MRLSRRAAASAAAITALLATSLATPATASETSTGTWRAYGNTNPITSSASTWRCTTTKDFDTGIKAQACAIRSTDHRSVQAAVIVRNNRSSIYRIKALPDLYSAVSGFPLGNWVCARSGVGANAWSVCFGKTLVSTDRVLAQGDVTDEVINYLSLGTTASV